MNNKQSCTKSDSVQINRQQKLDASFICFSFKRLETPDNVKHFCLGETLLMQYNYLGSCCCSQYDHDVWPLTWNHDNRIYFFPHFFNLTLLAYT